MDLFDQVIIDTMKEYKIKCGSVIIGQEGKILYRQGTSSIFFFFSITVVVYMILLSFIICYYIQVRNMIVYLMHM